MRIDIFNFLTGMYLQLVVEVQADLCLLKLNQGKAIRTTLSKITTV